MTREHLMSEIQRTEEHGIHPDFPVEPIRGVIGGAQPKLLLSKSKSESDTYVSPRRSPEEIMHRFTVADAIAGQLVNYFKRKKTDYPGWTDEKNYERTHLALIEKANEEEWPYTDAEQGRIMDRLRQRSAELKNGLSAAIRP
jgi:hypothetical protein